MKWIIATTLTAILSFIAGMFLPWWTIGIAAFVIALLMPVRPAAAFASGFVGVFILWLILSMMIDFRNEHVLASRVAAILPLGGSVGVLIAITCFLGGLVAGLSALSGRLLYRVLYL